MKSSVSSVKVTEAATAKTLSEPPQLCGVKHQPSVTVTEETSRPPANQEPAEMSPDASKNKKKKKKKGLKLEMDHAESQVTAEISPVTDSRAATKRKKSLKTEKKKEEEEEETRVNSVSPEAAGPETLKADSDTGAIKKSKKKNRKLEAGNTDVNHESSSVTVETPPGGPSKPPQKKKKKKDKQASTTVEASPDAEGSTAPPLKKKRGNQEENKSTEEERVMAGTPQVKVTRNVSKTSAKKNKKKLPAASADETKAPSLAQEVGSEAPQLPEVQTEVFLSAGKPKKKRKIPVVFEFEADELEAAASTNGLTEDEEAPPARVSVQRSQTTEAEDLQINSPK